MKKAHVTLVSIGAGCAMIYALAFIYFHPHVPIALPNATTCQVYGIEGVSDIKLARALALANGEPPPVLPPQLDRYHWIISGPTVCNRDIMIAAKDLISNQRSYRRIIDDGKGVFHPTYAYKMSGRSGSVIIWLDFLGGWVDIERLDVSGKTVADSGIVQGHGEWIRLLKRTMPNDEAVENIWRRYTAEGQAESWLERFLVRIS